MAGPLSKITDRTNSGSKKSFSLLYPSDLMSDTDGHGYFSTFTPQQRKSVRATGKVDGTEQKKQLKRAGVSIALYMPPATSVNYATQWGAQDVGAVGAALSDASADAGFSKEALTAAMASVAGDAAGLATDAVFAKSAAGLVGDTGGAAVDFSRKATKNSEARMLFQSVDFRTFTFDYHFSPKSPEESNTVMEIIKVFKQNMMPTRSGVLLNYPPEWDISYESINVDSPKYLHDFKPAVLTSLNVDYGSNGVWTTFNTGAPTDIKITLAFQETQFLTLEDFETKGNF